MKVIITVWVWFLTIFCMVLHDVIYILFRWFVKEPYQFNCAIWQPLLRCLFPISGLRIHANGLENIPSEGPYIIASTHQSLMDIPLLLSVVPPGIAFYAKKELIKVPFVGWSLKGMDCFLIDRKNPRNAIKEMAISRQKIESGRTVLIFPEGTRSKDGRLGTFKRGAFSVAVQTGVPIIPCVIDGAHQILKKGQMWFRPGTVSITFGKPITVEKVEKPLEKEASDSVMQQTLSQIKSLLELSRNT